MYGSAVPLATPDGVDDPAPPCRVSTRMVVCDSGQTQRRAERASVASMLILKPLGACVLRISRLLDLIETVVLSDRARWQRMRRWAVWSGGALATAQSFQPDQQPVVEGCAALEADPGGGEEGVQQAGVAGCWGRMPAPLHASMEAG